MTLSPVPDCLRSIGLPPVRRRHVGPIAVTSTGDGPALVLVHGGAGSWTHWARNIGPLAQNFTVHAIDLPGHGSSADVAANMAFDDYIDLLCTAIETLPAKGERLGLAAFSFGTALSAAIAARLGDRLYGLSLLGPGGFPVAPGRPEIHLKGLRRDMSRDEMHEVHRHNLAAMMLSGPEKVDETAILLQAENVAQRRFRHGWTGTLNNTPAYLAALRCPLQLVWGGKDPFPWPSIDARIQQCRAIVPGLETVVLAEAGHWAQYEAAAAYNTALSDFLTQHC